MNLIFTNGEKLYEKESIKKDNCIKTMEDMCGFFSLPTYQKELLDNIINESKNKSKPDFTVFGDDFKVSILPRNLYDDCVISITDYDKDQKLESKISIDFNKDELNQFINLLKIVHSKL